MCDRLVFEVSGLKINQKFGIKCLVLITDFEMQMGTTATSRISTKSDYLAGFDIFVGLYV